MFSQSQKLPKSNTNTKSKVKQFIDEPIYEISLSFTNNLFQTYLFEIFEKLKITLTANEIRYPQQVVMNVSNLIRINYRSELFFILFIDKETLYQWSINNHLICTLELLFTVTLSLNITVILMDVPQNFSLKIQNEIITKEEIIFFLNCELKVKSVECLNNNDLVEFLVNYTDAMTKKEEKSKITFFESKPVTSTNLCEIENINDDKQIMFVKHLMCIPGISERKAIAVVKVYPHLTSLMTIYKSEEYNEVEKENLLKDLEIEDKGKNTIKRFGQALSQKVYKTFYNNNPNSIIN